MFRNQINPLSGLIAVALMITANVVGERAFAQSCPTGAPITLADLQAKAPVVPADLCINATHTQLANFAWREFIAVNNLAGPALPANRGMPAPNTSFVNTGASNAGPLVWETFAHRSELLPAGQTSLAPWGNSPKYIYQKITVQSGQAQYNNLDESTEIGQNTMIFPTNPPMPAMNGGNYNPDADQQILYEAKVNETEYNFVAGHLAQLFAKGPTQPFRLPAGSIEVKAGWRLADSTIDTSRYHTADVNFYTAGNPPVLQAATYALVGLHIIHKTPNYPTFIYVTFEQIDAMQTPAGTATGLYYVANYDTVAYNPSSTDPTATFPTGSTSTGVQTTASGTTTINLPVGKLTDFYANQSPPPASGSKGIPSGMAGPILVIQEALISNDVVAVNQNVHNLMLTSGSGFENSVWQYYQLKGVQGVSYPTNSYPTNLSTNLDYHLASIVIESSQPGVQLFAGSLGLTASEPPIVSGTIGLRRDNASVTNPQLGATGAKTFLMGGCMGCHGNAQQDGAGFSFLIDGPGANASGPNKMQISGFEAPDTRGLPPDSATAAALAVEYSFPARKR